MNGFEPGALVRCRGREWIVLANSGPDLLMVKPVGGLDEEITGILPDIEEVASATFPYPTLNDVGDFRSCALLRDAARLSTRAAAGPFRSFGRISVEPRPYQLVPLMMALRLDTVRMLIADDVGIGKTIEAILIARELLDRGEIKRMAVLCPPHLAEQWRDELNEKFHIEAELVLSSTITRLERDLSVGVSVFDRHRFTVVSTDFIKSPRRAEDFILKCPEFVIVDEAHGCSVSGGAGRARHQRHELVKRISEDESRHVVLVTATPHSGDEEAFRSLLGLLDREFLALPHDLEGSNRESARRKLARHLVQRRRGDIQSYLDEDTAFPTRLDREKTYRFSKAYGDLFHEILSFAKDFVSVDSDGRERRVRYWSALALLRCVSSSPAAAAATLRSRAAVDEAEDDAIDDVGRRAVLDQVDDDDDLSIDLNPGSLLEEETDKYRRKMLEFARKAEAIAIGDDAKFTVAAKEIKDLLNDGFRPVVFCRFIDTAEYVAKNLRDSLPNNVRVESVTGKLPPAERESRIASLADENEKYVLVCTDCLSEGINLQHYFDSVFHYDLAWNPTRHEQREGRVDRFGQPKEEVRVMTYFGEDNPIDGVILDVLLRKHKKIKSDLGVAVSLPNSSEKIAEALFQGALFKGGGEQLVFDFIDKMDTFKEFEDEWVKASEREAESWSRFAQRTLDEVVVAAEMENVRSAIGRSADVQKFFKAVLHAVNVPFVLNGSIKVEVSSETPRTLRQSIGTDEPFAGRFELPISAREIYLGRTSPVVEGLASWTLDQALDAQAREHSDKPIASRAGVIRTAAVSTRTVLLIGRFRYHLKTGRGEAGTILCEEIAPLAFSGSLNDPDWLSGEQAEMLLDAEPESNLPATAVEQQISALYESFPKLQELLGSLAIERADAQLEAHERVREAAKATGKVSVEPVLPVDVLGAYILLPRIG